MNYLDMFKKREGIAKPSSSEIPARFVRKGGVLKEFVSPYQLQLYPSKKHLSGRYEQSIPENEISESYILGKQSQQPNSAPNSTKGARRKFAPSFPLLRKKKHQTVNLPNHENEEDLTEIAYYEDIVSEQQDINPVFLGQLDDSQLSNIDLESCEKEYKNRVEFILNNYRQPPPYPGQADQYKAQNKSDPLQKQNDIDTPLIRQLLKDRNLNDNASMNNFWQAAPVSRQVLHTESKANDKLVNRTRNVVASAGLSENSLNAGELYAKRKQYYIESINSLNEPIHQSLQGNKSVDQIDTVSEIYPTRDYEVHLEGKCISMSASVPNLSVQQADNKEKHAAFRQPRAHMEPGEMEALIAHYRKTSLDSLEPYSSSGESVSLYSQDSPSSYVPPSPYLSAEIPEWLQLYAKASPELDKYLKWEMFRYPELDCWQTMLKRLYKKELEQVVLWFEEYRHALQQELKCRHGDNSALVIKKTKV